MPFRAYMSKARFPVVVCKVKLRCFSCCINETFVPGFPSHEVPRSRFRRRAKDSYFRFKKSSFGHQTPPQCEQSGSHGKSHTHASSPDEYYEYLDMF